MLIGWAFENETVQKLHPMDEGEHDFKFLPADELFLLRGSDEVLAPSDGLMAWDHFMERCSLPSSRGTRDGDGQLTLDGFAPRRAGPPADC